MVGIRRLGLGIAAVNLLVACGGEAALTAQRAGDSRPVAAGDGAAVGTITGTLLLVGGPATAEPRSAPGTVVAVPVGPSAATGPVDVAVGNDGRFAVSLPAGTYSLRGWSPRFASSTIPCQAAGEVGLEPAGAVQADVVCHRK